ncbi:MAG TPA: ABC transporter six-transmembrane domain-containing protein [Bacteroidales bacterium]|nr:ABC transporter six-transmembrane domain-containing protein [Bacteroidales bacterium]
MTIRQVILRYRYSIGLLLLFVLIENVAWIIEPTFFGKLLDALIGHFYDHENINYFLPLFIWILIYFINVLGGSLHRYFNGGIYARMYADVATEVINESKSRGDQFSKMLVRTELVKEYISFFKERVPEMLWQLSASVGAVIALFFYDYRIGLVCLAVIGPVAWINNLNRKKISHLQKDIHDTQEELYRLIETRDTSRIHHFFFNMILPRTRIAKWNSFTFTIVKAMLAVIFVVVLFICVDVDDFSTGKIYSIVAYLWTFIGQTDYLPDLMESLGSLKDLNMRFESAPDAGMSEGTVVS